MATGIPFPVVGVYRCLGVFRMALNTSEELESYSFYSEIKDLKEGC
jgi:hypothetical protein